MTIISPDTFAGPGTQDGAGRAAGLLTAKAVRDRSRQILAAGENDELEHFSVHMTRLDDTADYVVETIRQNYRDLKIPFHARWRHFKIDGVDRWAQMSKDITASLEAANALPGELARIRFDLAVTSVLLDAGAGPDWRYVDPVTGRDLVRSEGLAIASLEAFADGCFSSIGDRATMADAEGLMALSAEKLGAAFQVGEQNPLDGLAGRVGLLNRLGQALKNDPRYFGDDNVPRVGHLFDFIEREAESTSPEHPAISAPRLLEIILDAFESIWPGRLEIDGINLGDTWRHKRVVTDDKSTGLIPFHKLSQWLTYSLIEPLQDAGISVTAIDGLTGLAEYRNGGLFLDMAVIELRNPANGRARHEPGSELIVEWRALTVALLDHIADLVRQRLDRTAEELPLASILEGGTWSAGRRIAAECRTGGAPPLNIESDGSVF